MYPQGKEKVRNREGTTRRKKRVIWSHRWLEDVQTVLRVCVLYHSSLNTTVLATTYKIHYSRNINIININSCAENHCNTANQYF